MYSKIEKARIVADGKAAAKEDVYIHRFDTVLS
jgi:hypothetical protein